MVANRQDAWTPDDDLLLAEVTLRYIREGGTQLQAFEEVAEKLGRTSAACGFRWNSTVRNHYEAAIAIAKGQRQKEKMKRMKSGMNATRLPASNHSINGNSTLQTIDMETVISYLRHQQQKIEDATSSLEAMKKKLNEKEKEAEALKNENQMLKKDQHGAKSVNDDYIALLQIMEKARQLTLSEAKNKSIFKMDAQGNLERIKK